MSYAVAASRCVTLQPVKSRQQFWKISLLAIIFCLTVVLGNVSLKFIPVSFNQAIGATTPAFTAALALVLMNARETPVVYLSLVPVVVGVIIASGAEPMFNMVGFVAAVTAACARALKSVLQGLMLSDNNERMDSLSLLMYMAPIAVVALIPTTLIFEPDAPTLAMELGQSGSEWRCLGGAAGLQCLVTPTGTGLGLGYAFARGHDKHASIWPGQFVD
jgi:drug/metabolite transporter (DMT)-like permease